MKKAFRTDIFRSITHSLSRFFALLMIVALGTGFYTGLRSTSPDMKKTTDVYCDEAHMMDIHGVSTLGFTEDDVSSIRNTQGVANVMAGYSVDAISRLENKDHVIRIHSLPSDLSDNNNDYLNRPVLVAGRMPNQSGECIVSNQSFFSQKDVIGRKIILEDPENTLSDQLKKKEYTIVGVVDSAYYLSFSLGSTNLGSGNLDYFMFIPETDFSQSVYTDLFITVENAMALSAFSKEYEDLVSETSHRLKELADMRTPLRLNEVKQEAQQQLDKAIKEYDKAKQEAEEQLAEAKNTLESSQQEINRNQQKLNNARQALNTGETKWKNGVKEYEDGVNFLNEEKSNATKRFSSAQKTIDDALSEIYKNQKELQAAQQELDKQAPQIEQLRISLEQMNLQHQQLIDALNQAEDAGDQDSIDGISKQIEDLTQAMAPLYLAVNEYDESLAKVNAGYTSIENGKKQLDEQQKQLNQSREEAEKQFKLSEKKLDSAKQKLDESRIDLNSGYASLQTNLQKLEQAQNELNDGWDKYNTQKADAEKELADAKKKIDNGQSEIEAMKKPTWYLLDRGTNVGFASMTEDANRMASLSTVFPIIFFLVAVLVALTTMTRMVEEQRIVIGTYKALGYSNATIISKYLIYALIPTIIGCAVGIFICNALIPVVCWNSYRIMYTVPDILTPLYWEHAGVGCLASLACTLGATILSCLSSLRESPASLMQPKAPKAGKRILLEQITPIWKRLNFIHKVTARNLFRYKKRLFMTVIGIAGCTALLLTGFGIKDSVSAVVGLQYSEIYSYDTTIQIQSQDDISKEANQIIENRKNFSDYLFTESKMVDIKTKNKTLSAYTVIPQEPYRIDSFITFRSRLIEKPISFQDDSVLITEKLAKQLNVKIGDIVSLKNSNEEFCDFTITDITENYIYSYIYIAPQQFEKVTGDKPDYQQIIAKSTAKSETDETRLSDSLLAESGINTVRFTRSLSENFDTMIASLDYVIMVIVLFAGLLAFIVLYNLTNINITERLREIATIKVLGFFDSEVGSYVFRETGILTAIGMVLGLVLDVVLHHFTITTVEVDMVMFGREINPISFVWSILLTVLFAVLVNFIMYRKLKKVSMVESLKSID